MILIIDEKLDVINVSLDKIVIDNHICTTVYLLCIDNLTKIFLDYIFKKNRNDFLRYKHAK